MAIHFQLPVPYNGVTLQIILWILRNFIGKSFALKEEERQGSPVLAVSLKVPSLASSRRTCFASPKSKIFATPTLSKPTFSGFYQYQSGDVEEQVLLVSQNCHQKKRKNRGKTHQITVNDTHIMQISQGSGQIFSHIYSLFKQDLGFMTSIPNKDIIF